MYSSLALDVANTAQIQVPRVAVGTLQVFPGLFLLFQKGVGLLHTNCQTHTEVL